MWLWILLACAIAYGTKGVGYLLPAKRLQHPHFLRIAGTMTIGLLAALVVTNTFVSPGPRLALDARAVALVAGAIALRLRAPYLVVVLVGALAAAGVRALGWAA